MFAFNLVCFVSTNKKIEFDIGCIFSTVIVIYKQKGIIFINDLSAISLNHWRYLCGWEFCTHHVMHYFLNLVCLAAVDSNCMITDRMT